MLADGALKREGAIIMAALARAGARFATRPLRGPAAAVALVGDVGAASDPSGEGGRAAAVARARAAAARPRLAALGGAAFFDVDRDTTVLGATVSSRSRKRT